VSLHGRIGVAVIVVSVVGAALALVARGRPANIPTVRVFVRLCAATAAVEALIGIALVIGGHRPAESIHYFYGAATVLPIPAADLLARRVSPGSETMYLLAGVVATALFGLRAVTTGNM
jgi:hypothetical protein